MTEPNGEKNDHIDETTTVGTIRSAEHGENTGSTGVETFGTSPDTDAMPNVSDALASLDALDLDRNNVADRLETGVRVPNTLIGGILGLANAGLYWFIGWALLAGHGEFTIIDVWIYVIVAVLIVGGYAMLTAHAQRVTGIGLWTRRQLSPTPQAMRDGRYRTAFIVFTTCSCVAVPGGMLLLGLLCAPWWPALIGIPLCALLSAVTYLRYYDAYMRLIRGPRFTGTGSHESEARHDRG
ncbi:hypothetical protein [Bifidobacterium parmae]|uniref:Uncharacterized protein n=1 Tax=Bifidobacterium parmae TaxID=361854 RepID=A0A2N5IYZ3_9BIFI|nr:hypothetical protein [Bifidobacterium parmae]PLS27173.1 hypothetical protein Uis4E_1759 [Bifidobacterium parmae]